MYLNLHEVVHVDALPVTVIPSGHTRELLIRTSRGEELEITMFADTPDALQIIEHDATIDTTYALKNAERKAKAGSR